MRMSLWVVLLGGLAAFPVSTRQAVDYEVKELRLPLGVKTSEFLLRDYWYRRMAREITQEARGDEARLNALLAWTREHIRRTPAGWPVVDDHILHTILRGYGEEDQRADVFTTLSSYAGIPSFWSVIKLGDAKGKRLVLSFCLLEGRWTVWDVARGIVFRNEKASMVSVSDLVADQRLVSMNVAGLKHQGRPYGEYLSEGLPYFFVPEFRRPQKQMLWPRVLFEFKRMWIRIASRQPSVDVEEFDPQPVFGHSR